MKEKLDTQLDNNQITQTRKQRVLIPFRDSAIEKITRTNTDFGGRPFKELKFDVPKGSSLKGLMLRYSRKTESKKFLLGFWFNKRNEYYIVGSYPNIRCKDVERICLELAETHQDDRGIWIKNPNQTRADEKKRDDLQDAIAAIKTIDIGLPIEFINFRD